MDKDARIAELEHTVRVLLDRQEIYDCLVRYARGVDRGDLALLLTAYHTDAMADCGAICASAAEMLKKSSSLSLDRSSEGLLTKAVPAAGCSRCMHAESA